MYILVRARNMKFTLQTNWTSLFHLMGVVFAVSFMLLLNPFAVRNFVFTNKESKTSNSCRWVMHCNAYSYRRDGSRGWFIFRKLWHYYGSFTFRAFGSRASAVLNDPLWMWQIVVWFRNISGYGCVLDLKFKLHHIHGVFRLPERAKRSKMWNVRIYEKLMFWSRLFRREIVCLFGNCSKIYSRVFFALPNILLFAEGNRIKSNAKQLYFSYELRISLIYKPL